jgi:hypothetical protein
MNFRLTIRQVMGCYLALALFMVPLLGLMHGIVHGFSHGLQSAVVSLNTQHRAQTSAVGGEPVHGVTGNVSGWSKNLFAGHGKAADCLVFDQLCHAQALHSQLAQTLPIMFPNIVLLTLAGDFIARWAALFQARGPPSAR